MEPLDQITDSKCNKPDYISNNVVNLKGLQHRRTSFSIVGSPGEEKYMEELLTYVPVVVVKKFLREKKYLTEPHCDVFIGAVLFVDVSGFTSLSERLAEQIDGTEQLKNDLNIYFESLIEIICKHGGDVVKFAGDAIIALWAEDAKENAPIKQEQAILEIFVRYASQCALEISSQLSTFTIGGEDVSIHSAIGASSKTFGMYTGGFQNKWEFLITGDPLLQIEIADKLASKGSIILSKEAFSVAEDHLNCERLDTESTAFKLNSMTSELPLKARAPPQVDNGVLPFLKSLIIDNVSLGLDQGVKFGWLGENRNVCCLFLNFPDIGHLKPAEIEVHEEDVLNQLQSVYYKTQKIMHQLEGTVNKILMDDKGINIVCAFGMPPMASHSDDPLRGVVAAMELNSEFGNSVRCKIGVSYGAVFCGTLGSNIRREYSMLGDTVNLAARLTPLSVYSGICISEDLYAKVTEHICCRKVTQSGVSLKGKSQKVTVWSPEYRYQNAAIVTANNNALVGREKEIEEFYKMIGQHLDWADAPKKKTLRKSKISKRSYKGRSSTGMQNTPVMLLQGEPGIGKSRLIKEFQNCLALPTFEGLAQSVEKDTPYFAYKKIINDIVDRVDEPNCEKALNMLMVNSPKYEEFKLKIQPFKTLFGLKNKNTENEFLSTSYDSQNEEESLFKPVEPASEGMAEFILEFLVHNFRNATELKLIMIDDVHWMDSSSWSITAELAEMELPMLSFVLSSRKWDDKNVAPPEFERISTRKNFSLVKLKPLTKDGSKTLVKRSLNVNSVPPQVANFLFEKTRGNPFQLEEYADYLVSTNQISISNSTIRITDFQKKQMNLKVPELIKAVLVAKISNIPPFESTILKLCSVVGEIFEKELIEYLYKNSTNHMDSVEEGRNCEVGLNRLVSLDMFETGHNGTYRFKQKMVREVCYEMSLQDIRIPTHSKIREWYEAKKKVSYYFSKYSAQLAYHSYGANETQRTIFYCEHAGREAAKSFSYPEAIKWFTTILQTEDERIDSEENYWVNELNRIQRADWEIELGESYASMGSLVEAEKLFLTALYRWEAELPPNKLKLVNPKVNEAYINFSKQYKKNITKTKLNKKQKEGEKKQKEKQKKKKILKLCKIYEKLATLYYYKNEKKCYIFCVEKHWSDFGELKDNVVEKFQILSHGILSQQLKSHPHKKMNERKNKLSAQDLLNKVQKNASEFTSTQFKMQTLQHQSYYYSMIGDLEQSREKSLEVADVAKQIGDTRRWITAQLNLLYLDMYEHPDKNPEEIAIFKKVLRNVLHRSRNVSNVILESKCLILYCSYNFDIGGIGEHLKLTDSFMKAHNEIILKSDLVHFKCLKAKHFLDTQNHLEALNVVEEAFEIMMNFVEITEFNMLLAIGELTNLYINIYVFQRNINSQRDQLKTIERRIGKCMKKFEKARGFVLATNLEAKLESTLKKLEISNVIKFSKLIK